MRPMTYIAAATVGLVTPVAFALPALAQPNGDDNLRDGNGDITITADQENGDVTFSIDGSDLNPSTEHEITSSDVDENCDSNDLDGATVTSDEDGDLDVTASATDCERGTYTIEIEELEEPFDTFSETVTVD